MFHCKDLASGSKTIIKASAVKHINVPQFDGLTVEDMLDYANDKPEVWRALPPKKEIPKLPRQYIANVIYTLVGQPFYDWVETQITARNNKIKAE